MSGEEKSTENMDRKNAGRTPSVPQKNGTDNAAASNKFPKKNRRKEGAQSGPRTRNECQAAYPRASTKYTDKRPRNRGFFNDRQREEVTEGLRTENASVLRMGSKKMNLNHLLNFSVGHDGDQYDSRFESNQASSGRSGGGRNKRWSKKSSVKYNKEQFLQANCQFVVKESGDYSVNFVDPDILVDWDLIEQVKIFGDQVPSCPICLYAPVAAKMTRCGHIYCWSCMLHYLSLSEKKTWRKCPICYEAVHQNDLKSVVALETHSYKPGNEITMNLMKREKGSTYTVPVNQWTERNQPHGVDDSVDLCFSKLLVASPDHVQKILDIERTALDTQMAEHAGTLEGCYVQAALDLLKERQVNVRLARAAKDSIHEKLEHLSQQVPKGANQETGSSFAPLRRVKDVIDYACAFSDEESANHDPPDSSPQGAHSSPEVQSAPDSQHLVRTTSESSDETGAAAPSPRQRHSEAEESPGNVICVATDDGQKVEVSVEEVAEDLSLPDAMVTANRKEEQGRASDARKGPDAFYFYQANDGQHIYLHSLNARCLVRQYGSLSQCPPQITASIVEMEGISMNQELRSRLRYLNHLPLTCEFKVAELALKPPLLSKETIAYFGDEVEKRRRLRQRKQRDEKRQLKKMQDVESRKYQHYPEMRALVSSSQPFPEITTKIVRSEMPKLLAKSESDTPVDTPVGSPSDTVAAGDDDGGQAGMSFAQMLCAGKVKSQPVGGAGGGWPRVAKPSDAAAGADAVSPTSDEDYNPAPSYGDSFGSAIETALKNYNEPPGSKPAPEGGAPSGGKKKKKQKKLLFTNTMACGK